jgi:hypothetical protein
MSRLQTTSPVLNEEGKERTAVMFWQAKRDDLFISPYFIEAKRWG